MDIDKADESLKPPSVAFMRVCKPISSSERKNLVDNYLTELSLLAKRLCPDARIEATTEAFEDEDGHVRIYPLAAISHQELKTNA